MKKRPIEIILVDDHDQVRESLKEVLSHREEFRIITTCSNGSEAIDVLSVYQPDILLIDINMRPMNGFETTKKITDMGCRTKIIGLSLNNQPSNVIRMLEAGAMGYITKTSPLQEIIEGIIAVAEGNEYICREIREKMG